MSEPEYDIVVLGAGYGGYATALRASQMGMKAALIDGDKVGGTCLHRDCIPTKAYLHAAQTADAACESETFAIRSTFEGIDMAIAGTYRDSVITKLDKGLQGLLSSHNVKVIKGWGRLTGANTVTVDGRDITARYRAVEYNLAGNRKSNILNTQGFIKLVSVEDGPIVGFHRIGARIGEQIDKGE